AEQLVKLLRRDVVFYPAEEGRMAEPLVLPARDGEARSALYLSENEKAVAAWVFQNNKRAGASTATLGSAKCLYFAVRSGATVYGVVGIALQPGEALDTFESNLVLSILTECALAVEKELFRQKREEAQTQAKNEQLRANLLRSISHDLRTPLTSISGNVGVLLSNNVSEETRNQIYTDIYDDAAWLINLVENLLSVTRIEDGSMHIHRQAELLDELVTEALGHVNRLSVEHEIRVALEDDLQLVKVDARLIMQVVVNMVDNAIKYTPPGSHITISSKRVGNMVEVSVADDGEGIPDAAKARIFEMFYTAGNQAADAKRGLGLGLALCKSIITAHGGEIEVGDHVPHGTVFRFTLPAEEVALHEP
ncbi:MAG: sensor histidine kinase, partial [Oscillospiraceae bacterium]